jgi:hypothetical protein
MTAAIVAALGSALLAAPAAGSLASGAVGLAQLQDAEVSNDFNRDGHEDLFAVRKSDGSLMFYAGNGNGTFDPAVSLGTGWGGRDLVMAGDLTGDGNPDLLARDAKTGTLYTYPGNGSGCFNSRVSSGTGWNGYSLISAAGDIDRDGNLDIYVVRKYDWRLYMFTGDGDGTFSTRIRIDDGYRSWAEVDTMTMADDDTFLIRYTTGGYLLAPRSRLDSNGFSYLDASLGQGTSERYSQVAGAGDVNDDGHPDVLAVDSRTGELELHTVAVAEDEGSASALRDPVVVGSGWNRMRLASNDTDRTYDYDGNAVQDFIVRGTDGQVWPEQPEVGANNWWGADSWGTGFKSMTLLETAGDFTGDGFSDFLARDASGYLYVYPGDGIMVGKVARIKVGTGWNSMSAIVGGQDFNGDGRTDLLAREKATGYLWLYPGAGSGKVGSRVKVGSGWNGMREMTAVGDLDHDGHDDMLAVRSSDNCLYFYGGRGNGTFKPAVQTGCGFAGYRDFASVGDADLDGHDDWAVRRTSDSRVSLFRGDGKGDYLGSVVIRDDWYTINLLA